MASLLSGWAEGYQEKKSEIRGLEKETRSANLAMQKERRLATMAGAAESRLMTGAAEDEYAKITAALKSPTWDPSQIGMLMDQAKNFDSTHGPMWKGKSAQRYVLDSLHIKDPNKSKHLSKPLAEKLGANEQHPQAGFATKKRWQEENIYKVQSALMTEIQKNAFSPEGQIIPEMLNRTILDFESQALASGAFKREDLYAVVSEVRTQMGQVKKDMLRGTPMADEWGQKVNDTSSMITDHVKTITGYKEGLLSIASTGGEKEKFIQLEGMAQSLATSGMSDNYIKAQIGRMAKSMDLAGGDMSEYWKIMAEMPPDAWQHVENAYQGAEFLNPNTGQVDFISEDRFIPLWDGQRAYLAPLDGSYKIPLGPVPGTTNDVPVGVAAPPGSIQHGAAPVGTAGGVAKPIIKQVAQEPGEPVVAPESQADTSTEEGRTQKSRAAVRGVAEEAGGAIKEFGTSFIKGQAAKKAKKKIPKAAISKNFEIAEEYGRTSLTAEEHVRLYRGESPEEVFGTEKK